MTSNLFSNFALNSLPLSNRLVMAPMTRCRATAQHIPTEIMTQYYAMRASAGLIITEGVGPSINGTGYARIPGIYNEAQKLGWKSVAKAVHENGGCKTFSFWSL